MHMQNNFPAINIYLAMSKCEFHFVSSCRGGLKISEDLEKFPKLSQKRNFDCFLDATLWKAGFKCQQKLKYIRLKSWDLAVWRSWRDCQINYLFDYLFNPFHVTGLFLYPLKTSENLRLFRRLRRGHRKWSVVWNSF